MHLSARTLPTPRVAAALLPLALAACGGGGGDAAPPPSLAWVQRNTSFAAEPTTPLRISGDVLAFLASESASNLDLNGDGALVDSVAIRVDTLALTQTVTRAAEDFLLLNETLFLVVDEGDDGFNWNGDGDTADRVLLYLTKTGTTPVYLTDLNPNVDLPAVVVGGRLLFVLPGAPTLEFDTNLASVTVATPGAAPSDLVRLTSTIDDIPDDGVSCTIREVVSNMVFLRLDETLDGPLNGDGDAFDTSILALVDAGDRDAQVVSTGLASHPDGDVDASGSSDWLVAFLVDENAEGVNLNSPALFTAPWQPTQCAAVSDVDASDHVLHWLIYSDFLAFGNVVNTGLVAPLDPTEHVYVNPNGWVGCVSRESAEGAAGGCDLNGDGDTADRIFRWVEALDPTAPVLPPTAESLLLAVADGVPGDGGDSTGGVLPLSDLWVLLVDEAADGRDHDGQPGTDVRLFATLQPGATTPVWDFTHGANQIAVSATWVAEDPRAPWRFVAAMTEASIDFDLNNDGDKADVVPTFPQVQNGTNLIFPGVGAALDPAQPGIATNTGRGFYRISEAQNGIDVNQDGDQADVLLQRIGITTGEPLVTMSISSQVPGLAVDLAPVNGSRLGAYLYQENLDGAAGFDLNGDGDVNDVVVRYFRFP